MSKKLVAYFSASGVTAKVAETLAEAIGADIFEIEPKVPYTEADLNWMDKKARSTIEMNDPVSRPEIAIKRDNMKDYDTIFVGFPIWWYVAPTIINTFLETVCLLSKLNAKQHIEVDIHMDELDLTDAEKKATYSEIKEYVLEHTGLKVSSLYIAQVKQKYGIIERENYNKPKSDDAKQPKCPPDKEKAIKEALKHFGMI